MTPKSEPVRRETQQNVRDAFALDPDWLHLNHGSFGARLKAVLTAQEAVRRRLEQNPTRWLVDEFPPALARSREAVGQWLGTRSESLAFFPSVTQAMNTAIRGFPDECKGRIVTTDQGYGAVDRALRYAASRAGGEVVLVPVPVPFNEPEFLAQWQRALEQGATLAVMDHITSPTGIELPVQAASHLAESLGIPVIVDGAHAPGQLPLEVDCLGVAAYVGSLHKWGSGPLGSAFLAMPDVAAVDPLVVGWGWQAGDDYQFPTAHDWPGTFDPSGLAALPDWLEQRKEYGLDSMDTCRERAFRFEQEVADRVGLPLPRGSSPQTCMSAFEVRSPNEAFRIRTELKEKHRCMVNAGVVGARGFVRASFYHYNTEDDGHRLLDLLGRVGAFR